MPRRAIDNTRMLFCYGCLWVFASAPGATNAAKQPAPRARPAAKRTPKKVASTRSPRKKRGKRRIKLPFPLANIKLPSNQSKLMKRSTWRRVKAPVRRKAAKKRKRLPLRRIKMAGKIKLKSRAGGWQSAPGYVRRRTRRQIKVQGIGSDRPHREVRLVTYRRWLGRHGWNRRWHGHVYVSKKKWRLQCPRKRFCHQLGIYIRRLIRAKPKKLNPAKPGFAWRLRRALERRHGFEVEVQIR